jgi:hypothetical protein
VNGEWTVSGPAPRAIAEVGIGAPP